MTKKKDSNHQRMLASARRALAMRHAVDPVPRINARLAGIDGVRKRARAVNAPTIEQEAKAPYIETDVNDYIGEHRVKIGRAYKRQARFETIEGLTFAQLLALKAYRKAFDESERSPVKSGLDVGAGGRTDASWAAISRVEKLAFADHEVRRIEALIGREVLFTLRLVALGDLDFKAVAVERFGSASARRRARVRDEFLRGAADLVAHTMPKASAKPKGEQIVEVAADQPLGSTDPGFIGDDGFLLPFAQIANIIRSRLVSGE